MTTTVGFANLGNRPAAVVREGLSRMMDDAAVISVCEAGDRRSLIEKLCDQRDWEPFFGKGEGAPSTPMFWNPELVRVPHEATRPSTDATNCGPLGAGPNVVKAKVLNHIRVVPENDDDPFVLIGLHMPASLYLRCRRNLGRRLIADLDDMVENREDRIDVVTVGDFNARANAAILKPLRAQGMVQRVDFNTKGLRTIDLGWTLNRRASARPFPGKWSDHRWFLLDVA